ncbi:MAG: hypothetical protein LBP43_04375 [Treponema sp.]|nr:hypothetical protein [Treponema sp.]
MVFLFLSPGIFLFFSCSRAEPRINYGFLELVYYQGLQSPEERFSFFILPEDDDGIDNLDELYLYHDREGLRWRLSSEDWVVFENEEQTWVGSRGIAMIDSGSLPRGQYRAVLINKGGERTERTFTFDAPEGPRYPFPSLDISEGIYRIDSDYPVHRFLCYDNQGNLVTVLPVEDTNGLVSDLKLVSLIRAFALWAEDPEYYTSALTDVVPLYDE